MKTEKVLSFLCAALMLASLLIMPTMAAEREQQVIDLGNGFYVVRTLTAQATTRAGNTVNGAVSDGLYYQGTKVGTAKLTAVFDISGSSAVATEAYLQGTGMNGWTYTDGGTYCGGARVTGVAIFESSSVFKQLPMEIRCTPDGELY